MTRQSPEDNWKLGVDLGWGFIGKRAYTDELRPVRLYTSQIEGGECKKLD